MRDYRCKRNSTLRPRVFDMLDTVPDGGKVKVGELAVRLSNSRLQVQPKTLANMLKEREDFQSLGNGIWERVPA